MSTHSVVMIVIIMILFVEKRRTEWTHKAQWALTVALARSSATAEVVHNAWNYHWRSFKVVRCCAYDKKWRKVIPKKSESKYVSALRKILNGPSLLTWRSAMSSIIFGPFRLLGNAHLFNWLFRWPVGVDMWCRSCRPEVRIRRQVREKNSTNFESAENVRSSNATSLDFFAITSQMTGWEGHLWTCI